MFFFFREKEKLREREDMWGRVEHLAMRNPGYQRGTLNAYRNSFDSCVTSPTGNDDDPDFSYEKLEAEAREVQVTVKSLHFNNPLVSEYDWDVTILFYHGYGYYSIVIVFMGRFQHFCYSNSKLSLNSLQSSLNVYQERVDGKFKTFFVLVLTKAI